MKRSVMLNLLRQGLSVSELAFYARTSELDMTARVAELQRTVRRRIRSGETSRRERKLRELQHEMARRVKVDWL